MASITIRNLDPASKERLRRRAAANGRSMEEEARLVLGGLESDPVPAHAVSPAAGSLAGKHVLLIIGGGIAAYKCLDLIRRLREKGARVRPVLTKAAQEFVTPLAVGALAADKVFSELFSREDEHDVGHIRLSREADLIVVAPATADLMAKMANGLADDLASAVLLATDKRVLVAPAMNPRMWDHPATRRNRARLEQDGVFFVGPNRGEMAESGERGTGRMAEPLEILAAVENLIEDRSKPLAGMSIVMTSGPTHEPIDPVRYIANRSSGKQGHAIAAALARLGATVHLVSGPVSIPDPLGVEVTKVETAREMRDAVERFLPADAAIMVAAVADWRTADAAGEKIKKQPGQAAPALQMVENPDILAGVGHHRQRPRLVVGFAAETQDLLSNARRKLDRKGADWIVANDVSHETGIMGGDRNMVRIITRTGVEEWPDLSKKDVAERLAARIAEALQTVEV
ncbi:bifunctional phosphopantothenoylcysteine decarboxylase/phosphopantothenate--cysteine ligase CoaBC [Phyllobacterium sp. 21LDTY02-6]|uniref:bifunctional phosphopantothenoylcysteine decarboxylase/phosphopantothenate--cysteine ligase CoaBC n=1 Tax=unclassified Phyllobacterium TaxID=2638441 RepID=UPI002020974B|nr:MULTISPECIES: bifunctional phosphopantothenoylcysteine decarboxylase/phosphopantothenate--cysteine ligase CoaBC [unclassified Phyllobacterium]MCO4317086.1 bifunctional phosphopantothenoylcysteine decarboxylase/phosphopantothenate--cysteine ligase CoaBC [Phyllobacterium sp. 21LDTY02-6]MCX8278650.1 bifunctional phosphopantothenoylcysteine decarboxylase/phosphopantothenate--cysteine ligase CoaBC [Phyllobacterium sp. 0TCS1.6C]MCX8293520.1 bifunctional phosphopantothenoylcysteine decarboxylase/pho